MQVHPFETPGPEIEASPSLSLTVLSRLDHLSLLPPPQLLTFVPVCPFLPLDSEVEESVAWLKLECDWRGPLLLLLIHDGSTRAAGWMPLHSPGHWLRNFEP